LEFVGGVNPRDTKVTPSVQGIIQKANPDVDLERVKTDPAYRAEIYRNRYWNTIDGDKLDPRVAHVAFDTSVIAGPGKARELLQASGGDPEKFLALREQFQNRLLAANPEKYGPYAKAWANRTATLRSDVGVGGGGQPGGMMAFGAQPGPAGPIQVAQGGAAPTMNDGNARVQQLYGIATNPMTSPVNRKIALDEIERLRKGSDPAAALELQIKQEQLRKLREGLQGEGATPLTDAERQQYNIPKGQAAYKTRGGDIKFGPAGTTVKSEGAIPPGHRAIRDADGNIMSVEPIPGSKEAKAAVNKDRQQKTYANIVIGSIDDIDRKLATAKIPPTGFFGGVSSKIPGTASHDIANLVDTIKANVSFERLNEMKAASPTGGALGAVSDQENRLLQRSLASLEQSQSPEQFRKNLDTVKNLYLDIVHGPGNRPASPADELKKKYGLE
jgi:hypothetical protein